MKRPTILTAVATIVSVGVTLLAPATAAHAGWGDKPPKGTSFWLSRSGDLIVLKRNGQRVRRANPLTPCFTGIRRSDGGYTGGGYNQGGGYTDGTVWFKFKPGKSAVKTDRSWDTFRGPWYYRASRWEAMNEANPPPNSIRGLFGDCELR